YSRRDRASGDDRCTGRVRSANLQVARRAGRADGERGERDQLDPEHRSGIVRKGKGRDDRLGVIDRRGNDRGRSYKARREVIAAYGASDRFERHLVPRISW